MSFELAFGPTPWNFWILLSAALAVAFAISAPKMSGKLYRVSRGVILFLFGCLVLLYALVSIGGLYVFGGRVNEWERLFLIAPVASPLPMLICLFSMRWASLLMWLFGLFLEGFYLSLNWPGIHGMLLTVTFDWPLLMAAIALTVITRQDRLRGTKAVFAQYVTNDFLKRHPFRSSALLFVVSEIYIHALWFLGAIPDSIPYLYLPSLWLVATIVLYVRSQISRLAHSDGQPPQQ